MDSGKVAISTAAKLATAPLVKQEKVLNLDGHKICQLVRNLREPQLSNARDEKHHASANLAHSAINGSPQQASPTSAKDDWIKAVISDLKNHRDTMHMVLVPICDEDRHVPLELVQKRTLLRLLMETQELHRDPEQALLGAPGANSRFH